jgi:hypothetical protein
VLAAAAVEGACNRLDVQLPRAFYVSSCEQKGEQWKDGEGGAICGGTHACMRRTLTPTKSALLLILNIHPDPSMRFNACGGVSRPKMYAFAQQCMYAFKAANGSAGTYPTSTSEASERRSVKRVLLSYLMSLPLGFGGPAAVSSCEGGKAMAAEEQGCGMHAPMLE